MMQVLYQWFQSGLPPPPPELKQEFEGLGA